jgi:hypothetical protein
MHTTTEEPRTLGQLGNATSARPALPQPTDAVKELCAAWQAFGGHSEDDRRTFNRSLLVLAERLGVKREFLEAKDRMMG